MAQQTHFSRTDINTGLSGFFFWVVFMGGYWQTALASSPIFVGYVLSLGADESAPSDIISLLYLMGMVQLFSHLITNRFRNKKLVVIICGVMEPVILIPFIVFPFFASTKTIITLIPFIVMLSAGFYHIGNPLLNAWYGSLIPDSIRASYIGRRIMFSQLTAVLSMFAAGQVVDLFGGLAGFSVAFTIGIVLAITANLSLSPVRYTPHITSRQIHFRDIIRIPRENRQFAVFSLFFGIWSIGYYIAIPNLNVLMIRHLHLSYSTIALYINCQLLMMLAGYSFWPRYIQKFGSRSLLRIILPPMVLIPLVWFMVEPSNHLILVPAMMLYGLTASGTIICSNTHLYSILPKDHRAPAHMVLWSVLVFGSMALGPKLASIIVRSTDGLNLTFGFLTVMNVKLTMLAVSASFFGAFLVLLRMEDRKPIPARVLVDQIFRRNPVSLAYNLFVLGRTSQETVRAYALERLGKTRGVVAFDTLENALEDISPLVRRQAAESIGETGLPEAVAPLARILRDPESDIRSEAATALGFIDTPESREAVFAALDDPDPAVRTAAISSIGRFEGREVDDRLLALAGTERNPSAFIALTDAISHRRNLEGIDPILRGREYFSSQRIRKQILRSLARMFGAGETFYGLICRGGDKSPRDVADYLKRISRRALRNPGWTESGMAAAFRDMAGAFEKNDTAEYLDSAERIARLLESGPSRDAELAIVAHTMCTLVRIKREGNIPNLPGKAFLAVCAGVAAERLARKQTGTEQSAQPAGA